MHSEDIRHAKIIHYYFKFKRLKRIKTKGPLKNAEVKIEDLLDMPPLEGNEEQIISELKETISERLKLNPRKRKKKGTELNILTPKQIINLIKILNSIFSAFLC